MSIVERTLELPLRTDPDGIIRVGGTRVPLESVLHQYQEGATAEQIQESFPTLLLSDVYKAIPYYLERPNQIDAYLIRQEKRERELKTKLGRQPALAALRGWVRALKAQRAFRKTNDAAVAH